MVRYTFARYPEVFHFELTGSGEHTGPPEAASADAEPPPGSTPSDSRGGACAGPDSGAEASPGGGGGAEPAAWWGLAAFEFAWGTIQARAFGRRLPWTALVPFADLLNHGNVATKYHFEPPPCGEAIFRLFPSGGNAYRAGAEVFNSYGRRPNDNLLLEYGFAMLDNEHDGVDLGVPMGGPGAGGFAARCEEPAWPARRRALTRAGVSTVRRWTS